jgi:RND family efflux transporter MFP subunit
MSIPGFRRAFTGSSIVILIAAAGLFALLSASATAHEGHDHGPAEAASGVTAPRVSAHSETYELVGVLRGDRLVIYLDRFATNEPVVSAEVAVTIGDASEPVTAEWATGGIYALTSPQFRAGGPIELIFSITDEAGDDLLAGTLTLPQTRADAAPDGSWFETVRNWLASLFGRGNDAVAASAGAGAPSFDAPRRQPDGHVFMPKPTQRLLDLMTERMAPQPAQRGVSLIGRIIADPNRTSLVQSVNGGRVIAPDAGLPRIGQAVKKGDLLAQVEPTLPQADRTTILEKLGEVEQLIAVAEARINRLRILVEKQVAAKGQLTDAEAEMEGLRRRREVLRHIRVEPEPLRAPTAGVIAASRVVPGQVVQAQDVLFQIVDPQSLWVEALVYGGEVDPASLGDATASAPGRPPMNLRFQGFSHALQQHATVVQFAIDEPPPNLSVGLPVTVVARIGEPLSAMIVPKDAVVRASNGEAVVWIHEMAELFEPRPVRITPLDASRVIVAAGVSKGERVVTRAAGLVNQVR